MESTAELTTNSASLCGIPLRNQKQIKLRLQSQPTIIIAQNSAFITCGRQLRFQFEIVSSQTSSVAVLVSLVVVCWCYRFVLPERGDAGVA